MMDRLVVGLDAWVSQDGNFGDFARGEAAAFALEWSAPAPLTRVAALTHLGQAHYAALGEVVHVAGDWWVIDIGVRAMGTDCPPPGDWLRGNLTLAIASFAYVERWLNSPARRRCSLTG